MRARSPYYREKFQHLPADCVDLARFPVTTKAELMAHFDQVVTDPSVTRAGVEEFIEDVGNVRRRFLGKYFVSHTSGSQGQPTLIVQDPAVLDLLFAFQMTRGNFGFGSALIEAARNLLRPSGVAVIINQQGFFPSAWVWQHLPEIMRVYVRFLFVSSNDPELIHKLNEFNPTAVSATPTTLDLLALKADEFSFSRLRQVVTWSETLAETARSRIKEAFRVPVMDNYASGECLFLTNGCPTSTGAHVNSDWAILEVVDNDHQPVPTGQTGSKVLLTNLANTVQPFIRYEIGDCLTMAAEPCGCGNRLPRIEKVLGRAADFFWVNTPAGYRPLTAYPFQHAFDYLREAREWQVEQVGRNEIIVRLEPLPGASLDLATAQKRLDERLATTGLQKELQIRIEIAPKLAVDPRSNKFRRMVSRMGVPDDLDPSLKNVSATDFTPN